MRWIRDNWDEIEWWADKANKVIQYIHKRVQEDAKHTEKMRAIRTGDIE